MKRLKKTLLCSLFSFALMSPAHGFVMGSGDTQITKSLIGTTGSANTSNDVYTLAYTWGEELSGRVVDGDREIVWGYIGGYMGSVSPLSYIKGQANTPPIL